MRDLDRMDHVLRSLKGGLIVSCQPIIGGALDKPEIVAAFAQAALDGGAVGLRIQGIADLKAVRPITNAPIIGLIKVDRADTPVHITPLPEHIKALADAGADIIAFDATDRVRPVPLETIVTTIQEVGKIGMADCALPEDGARAADLGCPVLASTLSGYAGGPALDGPDLDLVTALAGLGPFVIAEGRYQAPDDAARGMQAGADAIVAGSAITRPEHVTSWFVNAMQAQAQSSNQKAMGAVS
jgi:N-acylglucosamine-6-phosphate 2-epimerase